MTRLLVLQIDRIGQEQTHGHAGGGSACKLGGVARPDSGAIASAMGTDKSNNVTLLWAGVLGFVRGQHLLSIMSCGILDATPKQGISGTLFGTPTSISQVVAYPAILWPRSLPDRFGYKSVRHHAMIVFWFLEAMCK